MNKDEPFRCHQGLRVCYDLGYQCESCRIQDQRSAASETAGMNGFVRVPLLICNGALNYICHVGANHVMRGQPHPQQWLVDGLEAALKDAAPQAQGSPEHSMDSATPAAAASCAQSVEAGTIPEKCPHCSVALAADHWPFKRCWRNTEAFPQPSAPSSEAFTGDKLLDYFRSLLLSFGPDEGVQFDQSSWAAMRVNIEKLLSLSAAPAAAVASEHRCGVRGWNPELDGPCPACSAPSAKEFSLPPELTPILLLNAALCVEGVVEVPKDKRMAIVEKLHRLAKVIPNRSDIRNNSQKKS